MPEMVTFVAEQLQKAWQKKVKVGMGTDIGAGTTFNMLQTLNEAYKVLQLQI